MKARRERKDLSQIPEWMRERKCPRKAAYLSGTRIVPKPITGKESLSRPWLRDRPPTKRCVTAFAAGRLMAHTPGRSELSMPP